MNYCLYILIVLTGLSLSSCSHSSSWKISPSISNTDDRLSVAIPYASGDTSGALTSAIIYAIQSLPNVTISDTAPLLLQITILDDKEDKIGYRYDPLKKDTIIPNENRSRLLVSVTLLNRATNQPIWQTGYILGNVDYDHQNSSINHNTLTQSMGQLADLDTAQDVTYAPLYKNIADKIALWFQNEREFQQ